MPHQHMPEAAPGHLKQGAAKETKPWTYANLEMINVNLR
jgi:hypothetical protein